MHTGDSHFAAFHRLSKRFEHMSRKLRQLIEKQHAMMGHRDFTGPGNGAAADQGLGGGRMVRRADGPLVHQRHAIGKQSHG